MKKIILLFCFIVASSSAIAQLEFEEHFDYPAGDSIGAHGWVWNTGTVNTIFVSSPGLTYTGYPSSGNSCELKNTGNDAYRTFNEGDSVTSGSVYASFLVRLDSVRTGDYFLALLQTGSTTFYEGRVNVRLNAGNINFGITKGNAGSDLLVPGIWSTTSYSLGVTYLVVLKYTFISGTTSDDQVSLFVFSSGVPTTEPATPTIGPITYTSLDARSMGRIALRQGGTGPTAPNVIVDGIRVSTTWMPTVLNVRMAIQGLFIDLTDTHRRRDTAAVYLHSIVSPYPIIDSAISVIDSVTLYGSFVFANAATGTYYLEARFRNLPVFRNGINTWSKTGGEPFTQVIGGSYDFTTAASQAFGNNLFLIGTTYTIYNGDPVQEGTINLTDLLAIFNDATAFATGYRNTDINDDNVTTLPDILISFNNAAGFVSEKKPQ